MVMARLPWGRHFQVGGGAVLELSPTPDSNISVTNKLFLTFPFVFKHPSHLFRIRILKCVSFIL